MKNLQNFERSNFSAFKQVLETVRKFKGVIVNSEKELAACQSLLNRVEPSLKESVHKTFEELQTQRAGLEAKLQKVQEDKDEILNLYKEGIGALKRYELHPALCKDGKKQHLIDIYYAEASMDNFRKNCVAQLNKITAKMDELKKDFQFKFPQLINISSAIQEPSHLHQKLAQTKDRVKIDLMEDKQALLFSVLYTVSDDLKVLHANLDKLKAG